MLKLSANQKNCILKSIIFMLIFVVLLSGVSRIMTVNSLNEEFQLMTGIYQEEENSLDAVFLGSSATYAYWNPVIAWKEYGISGYLYNCSSQPLLVAEHLIKEARKTQPDALYIINVNTLGNDGVSDVVMHRLLDFMPFSAQKLQLTKYVADMKQLSFADRMEYYFPLLRYHSRWNELTAGYFSEWNNNIKNASMYSTYLSTSKDLSNDYITTNQRAEISDELNQSINSLLNYLEKEDIKAIFVTVPRLEKTENAQHINTVNDILSKSSFPVVNLSNSLEEIGLDLKWDFYNETHCNIHGSIKFTYYFAEYLIENYGFEDKRENPDYASWNEAVDNYTEILNPYIFDFELDNNNRNYDLAAVENMTIINNQQVRFVRWEPSVGADGYVVYRKTDSNWTYIGKTESCDYVDIYTEEGSAVSYTVVPYTQNDGDIFYGNFSYTGCS